ncbi:RpiB/LacA/LacB family sugar-phosphate isomerase [Blattabacterium cuenoti]|uniref:RpiB/LacA/LacB family sugar-phosphate isomerase n=1 Tax=Blattabacterium cuenoti TaxID=1653831 RepID=UPI00163B7F18|nr:RpiB/LacA/LacB family sugar-phosphate isomerase [Blattabacterium cuenoti]
MLIAIGSDHTGFFHKNIINIFLKEKGYKIKDFGLYEEEHINKVDYPDFIHPTANFVEKGKADFGIVICGSGNGAAMIANKYQKIRAALVWNKEIAILARKHNNANIISLPARFINLEKVIEIIDVFFKTNFEGGRHKIRIKKIPIIFNPQ